MCLVGHVFHPCVCLPVRDRNAIVGEKYGDCKANKFSNETPIIPRCIFAAVWLAMHSFDWFQEWNVQFQTHASKINGPIIFLIKYPTQVAAAYMAPLVCPAELDVPRPMHWTQQMIWPGWMEFGRGHPFHVINLSHLQKTAANDDSHATGRKYMETCILEIGG